MKQKKWLVWLLVALLLMQATGCGSTETEAETTAGDNVTETEAAETAAESESTWGNPDSAYQKL